MLKHLFYLIISLIFSVAVGQDVPKLAPLELMNIELEEYDPGEKIALIKFTVRALEGCVDQNNIDRTNVTKRVFVFTLYSTPCFDKYSSTFSKTVFISEVSFDSYYIFVNGLGGRTFLRPPDDPTLNKIPLVFDASKDVDRLEVLHFDGDTKGLALYASWNRVGYETMGHSVHKVENIFFISLIAKKLPPVREAQPAGGSGIRHLLLLPTQGAATGTYIVQVGNLETTFYITK